MSEIPTLKTTAGKAVHGENFFRGFAALRELLGKADYWAMMSLAVDGPLLDDEKCRYIDAMAASLLVPDPRTWLFKIPRLVASYGHALSGLAASNSCMRESIIGTPVARRSIRFFSEVSRRVGDDFDDPAAVDAVVAELKAEGTYFHGYRVPLRETDERAVWLEKWYLENGRVETRPWKLYQQLKRAVFDLRGVRPNIGGTISPIWTEVGLGPEQVNLLTNSYVLINSLCNAFEGVRVKPALYRRMPESVLEYSGRESRESPRARAAATDE